MVAMADDIVIKRFLSEIIQKISVLSDYNRITEEFSEIAKEILGIENLEVVIPTTTGTMGKLEEYVFNTGKPYVDNQLSDYSAFPELIDLKNRGYMSCAAIPFILNGHVNSIAKFASLSQEKFSPEILGMLNIGYSFVGSALSYRYESKKVAKLTDYFDGSFNSQVAQLIVDGSGKIIRANKEATGKFGLSIRGSNISELLGQDAMQLLSQPNKRQRFNIVSKDGLHKVFSVVCRQISQSLSVVSLQDETGSVYNELLQRIFSASEEAMMATTSSSLVLTSISASERWLGGYGPDMFIGKSILTLFPEQARKKIESSISGMKDGEVREITDKIEIGGRAIRCNAYFTMYLGVTTMLAISIESFQYAEDMKTALYDFIGETTDSVMEIDELGYIKDCNIATSKVLGITKQELIGKDIKSLYLDPSLLDRDLAYARNGTKIDNSYADIVVGADPKKVIPGTHSIRAVKDQSGSVRYLIIFKELATKRRLADLESELKSKISEANKLMNIGQQKTQFINDISHELKTPLTNIRGYSKLLYDQSGQSLTPMQKEYLSVILSECDRLTLIINQVLDASRLESKKMKLDIREVSLQQIRENPAIIGLAQAAAQKGLSFEWNVDYDVPTVKVDPNRLVQVFVNLIGNSIKFTDHGSISVRISMKSKKTVLVCVADTGIGISEEDKRRLFKKFYQVPKKSLVTQPGSGTGLGLSITKEIIRLFGGKIWLESTLGKGSSFYFTLPLSKKQTRQQREE
ncbi:MAG: ATP-binding protein [Candidatus Micrarchaeaceae archaeon]